MKKILITGAGGFIGSHLAECCVERGYRVKAFVKYNSMNSWGWLEHSPYRKEMEIVSGDIRDFQSVADAMKGCDGVFHLAALIGIPYSYVAPLEYIRTNIEGTYNVLESARKLNTSNIIVTSTSETYGTAQYVPIDEKHPMVGQSPYSASKIGADQMALSYYRSFGLPVKIIRPFNCFGPRQSARAVIPTIITQVLEDKKIISIGHVHPTRDLTYVKDLVIGYLAVANCKTLTGQVTNVGMNQEISIRELVLLVCELMNKKTQIKIEKKRQRPKASEVERLRCDNSRLSENTLWEPSYTLKKGLGETIKWYRKNHHLFKTERYTI